jgi:DNA-binding response OmpR family regulator
VLRHALQRSPGTLVIVMTGYGSITTAVAAIGQGAFDYKTKPFLLEEMGFSVRRAEAHLQLIRERDRLAGRVSDLERALAARSPGTQAGGGRAARQPRAPLEILEGQLSPREAFVSYRHWETAPPGAEGLAILEVLRRRGIISDDQHKLLHAQFSKGRAVVS